MAATGVRQLAEVQQAAFDHDYVTDAAFEAIAQQIDGQFGSDKFVVLDVGGGKGLFADRILRRYPAAAATVLDNSNLLLHQNAPDPRKHLLLASGTDLDGDLVERRFDLICFNFALHHFVSDSYSATRAMQRESLTKARRLLKPRGRLSVSEIAYNGAVVDNLPSRIAYELTSNRRLTPLTKRLGANTAGCGVCFLSAKTWRSEFARAGFQVAAATAESTPPMRLWTRLRLAAIAAADVRNTHFWLKPLDAR